MALQRLPNSMAVYWLPWTPFYLSRSELRLADLAPAAGEKDEHLASNVAFQAANRLELGVSFGDSPRHVGFGSFISSQPADCNDVQRTVGSAISSSIEPMPGDLAG